MSPVLVNSHPISAPSASGGVASQAQIDALNKLYSGGGSAQPASSASTGSAGTYKVGVGVGESKPQLKTPLGGSGVANPNSAFYQPKVGGSGVIPRASSTYDKYSPADWNPNKFNPAAQGASPPKTNSSPIPQAPKTTNSAPWSSSATPYSNTPVKQPAAFGTPDFASPKPQSNSSPTAAPTRPASSPSYAPASPAAVGRSGFGGGMAAAGLAGAALGAGAALATGSSLGGAAGNALGFLGGTALGGAIGGPIGAAIGGAIGAGLGQALGNALFPPSADPTFQNSGGGAMPDLNGVPIPQGGIYSGTTYRVGYDWYYKGQIQPHISGTVQAQGSGLSALLSSMVNHNFGSDWERKITGISPVNAPQGAPVPEYSQPTQKAPQPFPVTPAFDVAGNPIPTPTPQLPQSPQRAPQAQPQQAPQTQPQQDPQRTPQTPPSPVAPGASTQTPPSGTPYTPPFVPPPALTGGSPSAVGGTSTQSSTQLQPLKPVPQTGTTQQFSTPTSPITPSTGTGTGTPTTPTTPSTGTPGTGTTTSVVQTPSRNGDCCPPPPFNDELLKQIARTVGVTEFPSTLPLLTGDDNEEIKNLPELVVWTVKCLDAVTGKFPTEIEIVGADSQKRKVTLESVGHALEEIFGALVTVAEDADATVNIAARAAIESVQSKIAAKQAGEIATAISKFLGFNGKAVSKEVKIGFTPSAAGLDGKLQNQEMKEFLEPSTQKYVGYENDDEDELLPIIKRILEDGEIARAALYHPLRPKPNKDGEYGLTGEYLIKSKRKPSKAEKAAWEAFVKEFKIVTEAEVDDTKDTPGGKK